MADVIHKFGPFIRNDVQVEFKGQPLYVGTHIDGEIYMWCRLSTGVESSTRKARVVYTGEEYVGAYFGTVVKRTGFVYHIVEAT